MKTLDRLVPWGLWVVSLGLVVWGIAGLMEYMVPRLGFGLQDSNFPAGVQFVHFFAITVTGAIYVAGFLLRWSPTPFAMVTMYAVLATICYIEVMDFGAFGGGTRGVVTMIGEFALYTALSWYLLTSDVIRARFARDRETG